MKTIPLTQGKVALVDDEDYYKFCHLKWFAHKRGRWWYAARNEHRINGVGFFTLSLHRAIMQPPDNREVDHIDGDGLNCMRDNLRVCNHKQNMYNQRIRLGGKSIYKGVCWHKRVKRWTAQIGINGKLNHLGYFDREIDAARAYDTAALELFGEFSRINFRMVGND